MSGTTPALDEAFERMAAASFELPNGFVNHGAMACEALAVLDCADDIDSWARRFARAGGASVDPVVPAGFEWRQALGDYHRLPEWIGYFTQAIDDDGWPAVVAAWVPRLMPALRTALFHGAIRTAHAVRAVDAVDTPPRRGELARALGYWAPCPQDARFLPQPHGLTPRIEGSPNARRNTLGFSEVGKGACHPICPGHAPARSSIIGGPRAVDRLRRAVPGMGCGAVTASRGRS